MDIIEFKTGEKLPVAFPFEAIVELMGDYRITQYLSIYQSMKHQIQVLGAGLKYARLQQGEQFNMTAKEVFDLASNNMRQVREVHQIYDKELATYLNVYFRDEDSEEEEKEDLSEEDMEEQKEAVKP